MIYECVCSDGETLSPWLSGIKTGFECPQTSPGTEWTRKTKSATSTTVAIVAEPYPTPSVAPPATCMVCVAEWAGESRGTLFYWAGVDFFIDPDIFIRSVNSSGNSTTNFWQLYNTNITISASPLPYDIVVWFWQGSYDQNGFHHPYDPSSQDKRTIITPMLHDNDQAEAVKRVEDRFPQGMEFDLQFRITDSEEVWNSRNDRNTSKLPSCVVSDWETTDIPDTGGLTIPRRTINCYFACPLVV